MDDEHETKPPASDAEMLGVELAAAYAEIDRLRGLLGLPSLAAAANRAPTSVWEPTLFAPEPAMPSVLSDLSSNVEKVALFAARFAGRVDVYATRWESGSGKAGWSPAVKGGWAKAKAKVRQHLPLTDEVLAAHLRGDISVGVYPLLLGDSCRFLACDFDRSSWALDALAFFDACSDAGFRPRSSGPAPGTAPTSGSSSPRRFQRRPPALWEPACCAKRWRGEWRSTSRATTACSLPRTSSPRARSGT